MTKPITRKDVLRQLKSDLIGKDSYRGVTLTYSWLANQFGHFSLGYMPTLMLFSILNKHTDINKPAFWAAAIVSSLWLLFELYNFLGPLLLNRHSTSKVLYVPSHKPYTFQPAWANIAFDTFTDLCFFWNGAFWASLFLHFSLFVVYILIIDTLILLYPVSYWFLTKMYLQASMYPFQFRLSQWDLNINDSDKKAIQEFLDNKKQGKHLFVFGGRCSGKTSLSVGVSTELSIKHHACYYTTGMKLYNMFSETNDALLEDVNKALWTWRTSSVMIIDDINPGDPIKENLVTPAKFLEMLDLFKEHKEENRTAIKNKNVIWVLGNVDNINDWLLSWKGMLNSIGVKDYNILSINLGFQYM